MEMSVEEAIKKAQAVEITVKSEGWQYIMEMINGLLEKELLALKDQKIDHNHYRQAGMIQSLHFISTLANALSDRETQEYLLHQGRSIGLEALKKSPQLFFDGRRQGQEIMSRINPDENKLALQEKKKFLDDAYHNS